MKVGFVGTHNSGKTTIVKEIERRGLYAKHSYFTDITRTMTKTNISSLATQLSIFDNLVGAEKATNNFISDRTVLDNYAYFHWYYKSLPSKIAYSDLYTEYVVKFDKYMQTKPYDAVIFVDEYFPIANDGVRDTDEVFQGWVFEALDNIVPFKCEVYNIPFFKVQGSTETRIERVQEILAKYYVQTRLPDFF